MRTTMYEDIGGAPAVAAVVDAFYQRLLHDPDLAEFFAGKDMAGLKAHQRALVTVALGGTSEEYNGRMMQPAHAGLGITHDAFDRVLDHLSTVLAEASVPPVTTAKILAILEPLRSDVVEPAVAAQR